MTAEGSASEDELDRLTRSFEEQAAEDLQQMPANKANPNPKKRKNMKEVRDEGLQVPISESSKGFQMLAKMGYRKGHGLGKSNMGSVDPINLVLKERKTGLGVDEGFKERQEEVLQEQLKRNAKRQHLGAQLQHGFAGMQSAKMTERRYEGQVKAARQVIETLDRRKGLDRSFMWPPEPKQETWEDDAQEAEVVLEPDADEKEPTWEDQPAKNRLLTVLNYLRSQHLYCLHCGCEYTSAQDLEQSCPGLMDEDH